MTGPALMRCAARAGRLAGSCPRLRVTAPAWHARSVRAALTVSTAALAASLASRTAAGVPGAAERYHQRHHPDDEAEPGGDGRRRHDQPKRAVNTRPTGSLGRQALLLRCGGWLRPVAIEAESHGLDAW
jgi:hypothetical protein